MKTQNPLCALLLGAVFLVTPYANAQLTWDPTGGGASDGAGTWLTSGAWWNGAANVDWSDSSDVIFGNGGAGGAVTLASPTTVGSLTFNSFSGTYTLGTSGQALTINSGITMNAGSGAVSIISPITLGAAQSWLNNSSSLLTVGTDAVTNGGFLLTIGGTGDTTVSSSIDGAGGLTKFGTGILTLSGANTYTGLTTINDGTLVVDNNAGSGSLSSSSGLTFGGNGTFNYNGADAGSALSMGALTFAGGEGTVQSTYGTSGNTSLTFSSLVARTAGAVGNFTVSGGVNGTTNKIVLTGQATGFIDQGTYFGSGDYAYYDAAGFVRAAVYGTDTDFVTTAGGTTLGINDNTQHVELTGNVTAQTTASVADLKLNGAQSLTLATGNTLTINGIIKSGGGTGYIRGATGNNANHFVDNGGNELTIRTESSADTFSFAMIGGTNSRYITLQGSGGTTISGPGTVNMRLMANNTTGGINISGGTYVLINTESDSLGANNVTLNGGVLRTYYNTSFTNALGTGANEYQITGGVSGFSANGNLNFGNNANNVVQWGSATFNPGTFVLQGADITSGSLTFQNQIDLNGANRTVAVYGTGSSSATITGNIYNTAGTAAGLIKTGDGKLFLNPTNGTPYTYDGDTKILGGIVRFGTSWQNTWTDESLPSASNLEINGGIAEVWYNISRTLGAGAGQMQITGGRSGFSQLQGDQSNNIFWNFGNSATTITWGSSSFNPSTLVLNDAGAAAVLRMNNPFDLNGAARTIEVSATGGSGYGAYATMEGDLSGTGASLVKTGAGTLVLNGTNSYTGGTTINGGGLWFNQLVSMPASGAVTVNDGGILSVGVGNSGGWATGTSGAGTIGGLLAGVGGQSGSTVAYSGNVTLGFNPTGTQTYSGDIANVGTTLALHIGNKDAGPTNSPFTTTGTLNLSGNNTYTGGTILNYGGTLGIGSSTAIGSGTLTFAGGTLQSSDSTARTVSNTLLFDAHMAIGGTGDITFSDTSNTQISTTGSTRNFNITNSGTTTFNQVFTANSAAGLIKLGTGDMVLNGASSFGGLVEVRQGNLIAGTDSLSNTNGAFGKSTATIKVGLANNNVDAGVLAAGAFTIGRNFEVQSQDSSDTGTRVITFGGNTAHDSEFSGNIILGTTNRSTVGISLTAAAGGQSTFSGVISDPTGQSVGEAANALAGTAVTKVGAGTVVLTGTNTYSGATSINSGILAVNGTGSIGSSAVTINGGDFRYNSSTAYTGTLTFTSGTLSGTNWASSLNNLTIGTGQTVSPGNSPGTATTTDQTWANGGTYTWEINSTLGSAGVDPGWDLINGSGTLNITAALGSEFTIDITSLTLGNAAGVVSDFNGASNYNWMIADFATVTGFDAAAFTVDTSGFSNSFTGTFAVALGDSGSIGGDNTQIWLSYTAIPEPRAALLGCLGVLLLLRRRR